MPRISKYGAKVKKAQMKKTVSKVKSIFKKK